MRKRDARRPSHATLEECRSRAVQQIEAGHSPRQVIRTLGFSRARIYEPLVLYRQGELEALKAKPVPGRASKLDAKASQWIYHTVGARNPMQMKFEFALWAREKARGLVRERFAMRRSAVSVGRLLLHLPEPTFAILNDHPVHRSVCGQAIRCQPRPEAASVSLAAL